MSTVPGYHGRYLRIDLSERTSREVPWPDGVLRSFLGGGGLGAWALRHETPDGVDPLSPESPLVFVFSPLVGSPLTTSAKFAVLAKSPLTGRINDSLSSSHFAISGKRTGYDAIVIVGAAEGATTLVVTPDGVRFESAETEWAVARPGNACETGWAANGEASGWRQSAPLANGWSILRPSRTTLVMPDGVDSER